MVETPSHDRQQAWRSLLQSPHMRLISQPAAAQHPTPVLVHQEGGSRPVEGTDGPSSLSDALTGASCCFCLCFALPVPWTGPWAGELLGTMLAAPERSGSGSFARCFAAPLLTVAFCLAQRWSAADSPAATEVSSTCALLSC